MNPGKNLHKILWKTSIPRVWPYNGVHLNKSFDVLKLLLIKRTNTINCEMSELSVYRFDKSQRNVMDCTQFAFELI